MAITGNEATVSPPGGESSVACTEVGVQGTEVGASGELSVEFRLVVVDALRELAQLGDPVLSAGANRAQGLCRPRADRLLRPFQVGGREVSDLRRRQPESPQGADHADAPQGLSSNSW